jgi:hypothetical protein
VSVAEDISALAPGTYNITVTDTPTGCTAVAAIDVLDTPPTITIGNVVGNNTRCLAPFNGAIDITPGGSAGPFTYSWTGPSGFVSVAEDISALAPGTYNITVTDTPTGCTGVAAIDVLDAPPTLTLGNAVTDNTRCAAPFNGAVDLTVNGSAGPFTFSWTGPNGFVAATEDIAALETGAYSVTVTDVSSGCIVAGNFNVGNAAPVLSLGNVVTDNTRCVAPFDGAINLTVNGSAGPFTFSWTGPIGFVAAT